MRKFVVSIALIAPMAAYAQSPGQPSYEDLVAKYFRETGELRAEVGALLEQNADMKKRLETAEKAAKKDQK